MQIRASEIRGICYQTRTAAVAEVSYVTSLCLGVPCTSAAVRKQQVLKYGCTKERKKEAEQTVQKTKTKVQRGSNKGRELFITDFTVTALKPTWKRQAKHSKPRFPECFSNNSSFPVKHSNLLSPE